MIFGFSSTDEALEFGRTCSPEQVRQLREARHVAMRFTKKARAKGDLNLAMEYATQAQFCREALEARRMRIDNENTQEITVRM